MHCFKLCKAFKFPTEKSQRLENEERVKGAVGEDMCDIFLVFMYKSKLEAKLAKWMVAEAKEKFLHFPNDVLTAPEKTVK